jgi:transcriptional regulator with XRE-family HTH domain
MITTGRQIAAARALLGWSQKDLADASGLHTNAVAYWEGHDEIPHKGFRIPVACRRIQQAFLDAGVVTFIKPAAGVRFGGKSTINAHYAQARTRVMGSY